MNQLETPVLLLIFNRPAYTRRVFEAIRAARPKKLYISCDGPRTEAERALVAETRAITEEIDWPCEVRRQYAQKNLGLRYGPPSGIDFLFKHEERGIILEDDCLPHPDFFRFAELMLTTYERDPRVLMITGTNMRTDIPHEHSYFFSKFFNLWGWASWRRAWKQYDAQMAAWPLRKKERLIERSYCEWYMRRYAYDFIEGVYSGKIVTWDAAWLLMCLEQGGVCVTPSVNLISNIGSDGTHSGSSAQNHPVQPVAWESFSEPSDVAEDTVFDAAWHRTAFYQSRIGWMRRRARAWLMKQGWLKSRIKQLRAYAVAYKNKVTNKLWGTVHIAAQGSQKGTVLLSFITEPFTHTPNEFFSDPHTNPWACTELVSMLTKRGYAVDVINWNNTTFIPRKPYALCIDMQRNLERLAPYLPEQCVKVFFILSSYSSFQNEAEQKRLAYLERRRGVRIKPQRTEVATRSPAFADYIVGYGNKTVHETYAQFGKRVISIPGPVMQQFPFPEEKDFAQARKEFLWFGGGGAVLKGLDLTIEALASLPELTLHIVGPATEQDFKAAYRKELSSPNVHLYPRPRIDREGTMTIDGKPFTDVMNRCAAIIFPSASEGAGGSAVQAMHAGLIPIVTKESALDEDSPAIFVEPTVEAIRAAALGIAHANAEELKTRARASWNYARTHYTQDAFREGWDRFLNSLSL